MCAGELVALQTMTNVLNYLKVQKVDLAKVSQTVCVMSVDTYTSQLSEKFTIEDVKKMLGEIIDSCFTSAQEKQKKDGYIVLERGFATIPLPGIDVPFHSRYLWAGVMPFRACKPIFHRLLMNSYAESQTLGKKSIPFTSIQTCWSDATSQT